MTHTNTVSTSKSKYRVRVVIVLLCLAFVALLAIRVLNPGEVVGIHFYADTEDVTAQLANRNGVIAASCDSRLHGNFSVEIGSTSSMLWKNPEVRQTNLVDVEYLLNGVKVAFYDFSEGELTRIEP